MKHRLGLIWLPAVLLALVPVVSRADGKTLHLTDFRTLVRISSPRFSPDGEQIAF